MSTTGERRGLAISDGFLFLGSDTLRMRMNRPLCMKSGTNHIRLGDDSNIGFRCG